MDQVRREELFALYGFCVYMCQVVEHGVVNLLVYWEQLPRVLKGDLTRDGLDEAQEYLHRQTLGYLVRRVQAAEPAHELADRLSWAVDVRNWLAHDFWRVRVFRVGSEEGIAETLEDLGRIADRLDLLDREMRELSVGGLISEHQVPREMIEALFAEARDGSDEGRLPAGYEELPGGTDRLGEIDLGWK